MALAHVEFDATDESGNLLSNVQARVELEGGGLVSIYSDRAGSTPYSNPQTFADGKVSFYVAGGAYKVTLTVGTFSRELRYRASGLLQEKDALSAAAVAFTPAAGLLSTNVQSAIEEVAAAGGGAGGVLPNGQWLKGRNAADDADLEMFRVNSDDFTEWSNPLYYDDTGGFSDRQAKFTLQRDTGATAPSTVVASIYSLVESKGDNATLKGASAGYFDSRDRSDVTGSNKGVLHGLTVNVGPRVDRTNTPYDDAAALVVGNSGTARATEGIYIGHNVGGGGNDFLAAIGIDSHSADAAIYVNGAHNYGLDFVRGAGATLTTAAIRIPNNKSIVGRNAANSADVALIKLATDDAVIIRDSVLGVYGTHVLFSQPGIFPNTGLQVFDADASHRLSIVPGSNLTAARTLTLTTGDNSRTLDISAANVTVSSFGATLTDDADAAAARTTLGLGSASTQATGTSGATVPLLNAANTWSGRQDITASGSFAIPFGVASTNADAIAGPIISLDRQSASPAANDAIGAFFFYGRNTTPTSVQYAGLQGVITNATPAAEAGRFDFYTAVAGSVAVRVAMGAGMTVGAPTGGDMGLGTLNLDNDLYKDGTKVVSSRATGWAAATGTATRTTFATGSVTLPLLAERVKALIDDLTSHGLIGA